MVLEVRNLIKRLIVTERSTQMQSQGQYVLAVEKTATKGQIREAVEKVFGVDVLRVHTMRVQGKKRQRGMRRAGKKPDWKKAIVRLKPGQEIKVGEEVA